MFVNFIILTLVSSFIFFFGIIFLEFYCRLKIINNKNFLLSEILFIGLFFLCAITLLLNFFTRLGSPIVYIIIFSILFFSIINFYKNYYFHLKKIILFSFIFSPFIFILELGYDGALYHLPYQVILRDDKIIFGLSNLHNRYGLTGIYSYLVAPFWKNNFFNFQSALATIFYLNFFLFLYEQFKFNSFIKTFLLFPAFFISFLSIRYAPFSYAQIDFVYGCLYFISIIYGIYILIDKNVNENKNIFLFIIFAIFTAMSKPSGFIILIYIFLIISTRFIIGNLSIKNLFNLSIFPMTIYCAWLSRNIINTGCIFYPISFTCQDFKWALNKGELYNLNISIYNWAFNYSNIFIKQISLVYIILFLISFILIFLFLKKIFLNFLKKNKYFIFVNLIILLILIYIFRVSSLPLTGISNLLSIKDFKNLYYIFQFEFINLVAVSLIILLFSIALYFCSNHKKYNFGFNYSLIPLLFLIFNIIILFKFAPNPRFGIGVFLIFFSSIFFLFVPIKDFKINKFILNYFIFSFFALLFNFYFNTNIDKFKNKSLIFNRVFVEEINLLKRKGFGYSPLHPENRPDLAGLCYLSKNCYPYDDVIMKYNRLGYKFYYK